MAELLGGVDFKGPVPLDVRNRREIIKAVARAAYKNGWAIKSACVVDRGEISTLNLYGEATHYHSVDPVAIQCIADDLEGIVPHG